MKRHNYIRSIIVVVFMALITTANAQHFTEFEFVGESAPTNIQQTMQNNAKAVFKQIHDSYFNKKSNISLSQNNATDEAIKRIQALWSTSKFYCTETEVIQPILRMSGGKYYQVRNVPVFFVGGATEEDKYQELVLEFTSNGKISDIYIALSGNQYKIILDGAGEVTDLRRRQLILGFVENFRTAYNRKDIVYIEQVFSEDALIIIGKILEQSGDGLPNTVHVVKKKKEYMTDLKRVFTNNSFINVKFDEIEVIQSETNPNVYGVTLQQKWNSSTYKDEGWLFLMIDFQNEDKPQIWVRTWDPLNMPKIERGSLIQFAH